ncbi:hypothetical protein IRT45_05085 [Nocardia sp. BSTN01]|uniref:hypothetical protein n=1 Tax=Nocardia sp. BSTN01 TaxID=2783665 RepID=UPI0018906FB1|nr:hypothetical protein [Nocardia sp. BSTN01]MBF4996527.1 hypothetical protein [Nocardia sp. BSTN01]
MDLSKNHDASNSAGYEAYPTECDSSPAALPAYVTPSHDHQPDGGVLEHPTRMPGPVRGARIISWLFGGLGVALSVLAGTMDKPELCGALIAGYLPAFFLAIFAFGFTVNGNGLRVAAIVVASFGILWGLGSTPQGHPPGPLGFGASLAIVILLSRPSAEAWFKRPH